uniref:Uncharacterized protein n=1 Tax=Parastrongyloides trichosuri TaxID=131310 RepID=A0A0N4ZZ78_PARTI
MPNNNKTTNIILGGRKENKRGGYGGCNSPNSSSDSTGPSNSSQNSSYGSKVVTPRRNGKNNNVRRPTSLVVYEVCSSDSGLSSPPRSYHSSGSPIQLSRQHQKKNNQYSSFHSNISPSTTPNRGKGFNYGNQSSYNNTSTQQGTRNNNGSPKNSRRREGSTIISSQHQYFAASTTNGSPLPDKLPLPPTSWLNEISRSTQNTPVKASTLQTIENGIPQLAANSIRMNPFHLIAAVAAS